MLVAVICILVIALIIYHYEQSKKNTPLSITGGVSAFGKIADAETKRAEASGKLIALKLATEAQQASAAELKDAAIDAHHAVDVVHDDLDEVHEILG